MSRKRIEIDFEQFEKLCGIQATLEEIASWFNCSPDTIERACRKQYKKIFADIFREKRSRGHTSLRRKQYELALSGNVTMLIWLGKQYLSQKDKPDESERAGATYVVIDKFTEGKIVGQTELQTLPTG